MSTITKPIMTDETGQALVNALLQNDIVAQKTAEISRNANEILAEVIESIPPDYTELTQKVNMLTEFVTPEMYGAAGNGVTDDTQAVQNAVDSGKAVLFTNKYLITSSIIVENDCTFYGQSGSMLYYNTNGLMFRIKAPVTFIRVNATSLYMDERTSTKGCSFCKSYSDDYKRVYAFECNITDFRSGFDSIGSNSIISGNTIIMLEVTNEQNNTYYGIHGECSNCVYENNTIKNGRHCIYLSGKCENMIVRNNKLHESKWESIHIYSTSTSRKAKNCIISGNIIDTTAKACITCTGYSSGVKITENTLTCNNNYCVYIEGGNYQEQMDIVISNNKMTGKYGIYCRVANQVAIYGNHISVNDNSVFCETASRYIKVFNNVIFANENTANVLAFISARFCDCINNIVYNLPESLYRRNGYKTCGFWIEACTDFAANDNLVNGYLIRSVYRTTDNNYAIFKLGELYRSSDAIPEVYHNVGDKYTYTIGTTVLYSICESEGNPGTFSQARLASE